MGLHDRISAGMHSFRHPDERFEQEYAERMMASALENANAREDYAQYQAAHLEYRARRSEDRARHEYHRRVEERRRSEDQARRFQGQVYHDRSRRVADLRWSERHGFGNGYVHGYMDAAYERDPSAHRQSRFEDASSARRREEQMRAHQHAANPGHASDRHRGPPWHSSLGQHHADSSSHRPKPNHDHHPNERINPFPHFAQWHGYAQTEHGGSVR